MCPQAGRRAREGSFTMPAVAPKTPLAVGAGRLYHAPLLTSLPSYTVTASVFTDITWTGWSLLGITKNGHEFSYDLNTDTIDAAEYIDPITTVATGRTVSMKFELQVISMSNIRKMLNAGTSTVTTSGSGTTLRTTFTPPAIGTEVRCMIGWQAEDDTERVVAQQAFQVGSLAIARNKGSANATLPVEFRFEPDTNGFPYLYDTAGPTRGA